MSEIPLKLVDVIRTLAAPTGMLAINGIHTQSARPNTQNQRILQTKSAFNELDESGEFDLNELSTSRNLHTPYFAE